MPPIPSHFDFYLTTMADWPASFFIDLGLAAHAPLPGLVQRLHVTASLKRPRADGMRDRLEAEELHAMEDAVTRQVDRLGGRYVGRITWQGRSDAVFYLPGTVEDLSAVEDATGDYQVSLRMESDPEWRFYREFLMPNPYQHQTMLNRRVLAALAEQGDDGTTPREVDHVFLCHTPTPLQQLAGALATRGFRCDPLGRSENGEHMLQAHRDEAPAFPRMDEVAAEIFQAMPSGVSYDGWGCGVVPRA